MEIYKITNGTKKVHISTPIHTFHIKREQRDSQQSQVAALLQG